MRFSRPLTALAVVALSFAGCSNSSTPTSSTAPNGSAAAGAPLAANSGLTIFYEENCQVELIAPGGRRVLIDVWNPATLSSPAKATDVLLSTHLHSDHYNQVWADAFPGKKITNESTQLSLDDLSVTSIAASHTGDSVQADPNATNHIFIIDFDGFHIVHTGSTGQTKLTDVQVAAIGSPDIAFSVLQDVSGTNQVNPLKQIEQMNPKLLIPTHASLDPVQAAGKEWGGTYTEKPSVTITKDQLPTKTELFFMGQQASTYGAVLKIAASAW
jgi:L-ascorbate metabolism protein UlaG (beta-lactamase superfamily)